MSIFPLENYVSSDDLIARRDELKDERDALMEKIEDFKLLLDDDELSVDDRDAAHDGLNDTTDELDKWISENSEEFAILTKVCEDGSNYIDDWEYGATLYHEDIFDDHAEELAKDCSDVPRDQWNQWPFTCIDWKEAANVLKQDYTTIEIDGETYYAR